MCVIGQVFEALASQGSIISTRSEGTSNNPSLATEAHLSADATVWKPRTDGICVLGIGEGVLAEAVPNLPAEQGLPRRVACRNLFDSRTRRRRHNVQPASEFNVSPMRGIAVIEVVPQAEAPNPETGLRESGTRFQLGRGPPELQRVAVALTRHGALQAA
jgi:hypothetical protein